MRRRKSKPEDQRMFFRPWNPTLRRSRKVKITLNEEDHRLLNRLHFEATMVCRGCGLHPQQLKTMQPHTIPVILLEKIREYETCLTALSVKYDFIRESLTRGAGIPTSDRTFIAERVVKLWKKDQ